ncbi:N-acetyltransferase family protein [Herbiconiux sp. A18JL235]|uniref:N-acetyltransferase family protein n=1 Tax=Herbiconiux sp. A18JL235 TaxID=3152363 RepID=A0AB39BJJ0_9MICO
MTMSIRLRQGTTGDREQCLALWVAACAARDGRAVEGVADRARPKFDECVSWLIAGDRDRVDGFALSTRLRSGRGADPYDAAVLGLIATEPERQGRGLGRALLRAASRDLAALGYGRAVLHARLDNAIAVHLYESEGWVPSGEVYEHPLWRLPTRAFVRTLRTA